MGDAPTETRSRVARDYREWSRSYQRRGRDACRRANPEKSNAPINIGSSSFDFRNCWTVNALAIRNCLTGSSLLGSHCSCSESFAESADHQLALTKIYGLTPNLASPALFVSKVSLVRAALLQAASPIVKVGKMMWKLMTNASWGRERMTGSSPSPPHWFVAAVSRPKIET